MQFDQNSILYVIGFVAGLAGVPVINLIKQALGAYGGYALAVATAVCLLLAGVVVFLAGTFSGVVFDLDTVVKVSTEIFSVATILFKAFQADPVKK